LIKILQVRNIDSFVESRRQKTSEKDRKTVQKILNDVRKNGDSAVKKYERKFNGRKTSQLRVSEKEIKEALSKISYEESYALASLSGDCGFQAGSLMNDLGTLAKKKWRNDDPPSCDLTRSFVPIPSVGCYIPGGQARYPSSVFMSVKIAGVAGVKRRVIASPPGPTILSTFGMDFVPYASAPIACAPPTL
jgi:histidinol dehydrogenase